MYTANDHTQRIYLYRAEITSPRRCRLIINLKIHQLKKGCGHDMGEKKEW